MTLSTEAFGVMRQAIRLARTAGFARVRWSTPRTIVLPRPVARGAYNVVPTGTPRADGVHPATVRVPSPYVRVNEWLAPYWRERIVTDASCGELESIETTEAERELESIETTEAEREAFKCNDYVHAESISARFQFEYTDSEVEASTCERCDTRVMSEETYMVYSEEARAGSRRSSYVENTWCSDCVDSHAFMHGDEYYDLSLGVSVEDTGETVPLRYAQENYYFCDSNDTWYTDSSEAPTQEDEEDSEREADEDGTIYGYGTNVLHECQWPKNVTRDMLLFGVELEVEGHDFSTEEQHNVANALGGKSNAGYILAADGSLTNGVEIITVPQTLEQHHTGELIPWRQISKSLAGVKARSGAGTENCGMHVHINRQALTALTVGKMMCLVNSPKMLQLIEQVAQRRASNYCKQVQKKVSAALRESDHADHYTALNVGTEHNTLELRIFRGNTRHSRIMKNIEFAHALCIYCRDTSIVDIEKPDMLRAYIAQRPGQYPNLSKFLADAREDGAE